MALPSAKAAALLQLLAFTSWQVQQVAAGGEDSLGEGEDPCAKTQLEDYNLGLHIGSVFILLGVSLLGSFLPVVLRITSQHTFTQTFIKLGTFFGIGTILSTAFIHMLQPASENLSSPCLPESWTSKYEAWAYLFVVIAVLFMQLTDYMVEQAYTHFAKKDADMRGELHGAITHIHGSRHGDEGKEQPPVADAKAGGSGSEAEPQDEETGSCPQHGSGCHTLLKEEHRQVDISQVVGIYLMEAGIVFHSVLIGLTLGVTAGSAFTTLLIALSLHQLFEGFAIGSAAVDSGLTHRKAFLMGIIYSLTTPTGIAIGIGVRESFNQNAQRTLLVEGIFDALSSGILIYVVLVELMSPMMTQSKWLRAQRWWLQVLSFAALYGGTATMAVIGKWA